MFKPVSFGGLAQRPPRRPQGFQNFDQKLEGMYHAHMHGKPQFMKRAKRYGRQGVYMAATHSPAPLPQYPRRRRQYRPWDQG